MTEQFLILTVLLLIAFLLGLRYVYWRIDRRLQAYARAENDPVYRASVLAVLDEELRHSPNSVSARRRRAELRYFEENHAGAAEDWSVYLDQEPFDDTAWGELADACMRCGQLFKAQTAIERAIRLDADYLEYRVVALSIALLRKNETEAREALAAWRQMEAQRVQDGTRTQRPVQPDARLPVYEKAVLSLQGGRPVLLEEEASVLQGLAQDHPAMAAFQDSLASGEDHTHSQSIDHVRQTP